MLNRAKIDRFTVKGFSCLYVYGFRRWLLGRRSFDLLLPEVLEACMSEDVEIFEGLRFVSKIPGSSNAGSAFGFALVYIAQVPDQSRPVFQFKRP